MFKLVSHSVEQTEAAGEAIGKRLGKGEVIALFGDMGGGKTTITRGICRGLGSKNYVSSPTFAIVNEYSGRRKIYHFDMYRVAGEEDLESTGYYDCLDGESNLIIEWSENIRSELPDNAICVLMERGEKDGDREITVGMLSEMDI